MKLIWNCEKVDRCDAFKYDVVMEGKKEYPNQYIGYKKGTPDGTYKTSIIKLEKLFYEDCLKYNPVMIIQETGEESWMKKAEKEDLDKYDANTNPKYYNSSRSNGYQMDIDLSTVLDKVNNGEYEITSEPFDVVEKMEAGQKARSMEYVISHVVWIKDQMNDSDGKWLNDNNDAVLVLKDYFGKGKHWRIAKRHTILGISKTKFKPNLDVCWIPQSDWKKLESDEITELALLDNPVQHNKRLENDLEAVANFLTQYCERTNKDHTDAKVQEKLERMKYGATSIRGLKVRIKNKLEGSSKGLAPNEIFVPTTDADAIILAENYRDKNTHSISISSGYVGKLWEQIVKALEIPTVRKKPNWVISVYHSELKNYNKWETKKPQLRKHLNNLEDWLSVTKGKGADEETLQKINFIIREKNPIEKRT